MNVTNTNPANIPWPLPPMVKRGKHRGRHKGAFGGCTKTERAQRKARR